MPDNFSFAHPPFSELNDPQRQRLRQSLVIAYFAPHQPILEPGSQARYLHVIIKGAVEERLGEEIFAHYLSGDLFDVRSQLEERCRHQYLTLEETLCYQIPTTLFRSLLDENPAFGRYFNSRFSLRQQRHEQQVGRKNLAEFILTRIDQDCLQPATVVDGTTTIRDATAMLRELALDCLLVEQEGQYGMLTRTDLLDAAVLHEKPLDSPVAGLGHYRLVSLELGDYLFNAMLLMTRHQIERVVVMQDQRVAGILNMTRLLSLFSTHSHVLAIRILQARNFEELAAAAHKLRQLIANLVDKGIKLRFIMELLATLNEQIIRRVFEMQVPEAFRQQLCLVVLGSEGRGEQIMKTDQDNALVMHDALDWPDCTEVMAGLSERLLELGYPGCPGKVMVNNPQWVRSQRHWQQALAGWLDGATPDALIKLAIFCDSQAVAGNPTLLVPLRRQLFEQVRGRELLLAQFAQSALRFATPLTLFGNLKEGSDGLDLKRGGIFPIVHGVRALALEAGIEPTNTFSRLQQLASDGILEPAFVDDLGSALELFIRLRLEQQLQTGQSAVHAQTLPVAERDLLRHGLHLVKKFKQRLALHFHIRDY